MRKAIGFLVLGCSFLGCVERGSEDKISPAILTINFTPSFHESSETKLIIEDQTKTIQILINNSPASDKPLDTFCFRKVSLTNKLYEQLDGKLIHLCKRKYSTEREYGFDGINISSTFIDNGDTNRIFFWSPREENKEGYKFSKAVISVLKETFQDSIINQYFDDVSLYLGDPGNQTNKPPRAIDGLRKKKYNWEVD